MTEPMTVPGVRSRKGGKPLTMVTAYDTPTAQIASEAGADIILVGDSVANNVLGYEDTLAVDTDVMVHHTAAVSRARPHSLVVGDMPWMSYHVSVTDTVQNAGRFVREGGASAVKLEGGSKRIPMIEAILDAEIPVMGHIGLTPQSVHAMGGYRVQGRAAEAARQLMSDAKALDAAGVFAIVLEGVPDIAGKLITESVSVPTIGIGAGPNTDGQVLVFHDVVGLGSGRLPTFVRQYANLRSSAVEALRAFFDDVENGEFPAESESYHMSDEAMETLLSDLG